MPMIATCLLTLSAGGPHTSRGRFRAPDIHLASAADRTVVITIFAAGRRSAYRWLADGLAGDGSPFLVRRRSFLIDRQSTGAYLFQNSFP